MATKTLNILRIDASGRQRGSVSRRLTSDVVAALEMRHGNVDVVVRDLAAGIDLVDQRWIEANFTAAENRSPDQRDALAESDRLVAELQAADVLVVGTPVYNFGVPAALKAWVDMIARARLTFRYGENGPVGLLEGKKAYVVVTSGGTAIGSGTDFATPWLRHALKFVGITDVEVVAADRINLRGDTALDDARARIADLIHTAPLRKASAA